MAHSAWIFVQNLSVSKNLSFSCDFVRLYSQVSSASPQTFKFLEQIFTVPSDATTFFPWMTACFGLKRPSSGELYRHFKIIYKKVQIVYVVLGSIWLTRVIQYKIYINLCKNRIGNVPAGDFVQILYKKFKYRQKNW